MHVYKAIAAATLDISKEGIAKGRKNQQQGYSFRGIDDVYNTLAPILAKHGLCVLPRVLSRELVERQTRNGQPLFYVTVEVEFDFVSAEDGSKHAVKTYGEAMDSADKATNKAMSAAYKYAAMQAFCIPTEGDNDADSTTHEVAPRGAASARRSPPPPPPPPADDARILKDYDGFASALALCSSKEEMEETCEMHGIDAHSDPVAKRIVADHWRKINPNKRTA